jgi:anaerobic ribonucleoside-triphosphate reductase activating protein
LGDGAKKELFDALSKPYIRGLTLSGGHPLEDYNLEDLYLLLVDVKKNFPDKDIWLYTGLILNLSDFVHNDKNLMHDLRASILQCCDVIVDGPFIQEQRDITLQFRGSTNQRIIDVAKTIEQKEIVLWEKH